MQEEKNTLTKTNKKNRAFLPLMIIFVLLLVGLTIYVYRDTISASIKKIGFVSENGQDVVEENADDNSVFKQLASDGENDNKEYASVYTTEVVASLDSAHLFKGRFEEYGDGDWGKLIEENQVVLEVNENPEGSLFYTFVDSKNPNFKFENGAIVDFKPTVKTPGSLVVMEGIKTQFGYQEGDFNNLEKDIFRPGDKIIFVCDSPSCEGGVTKWLLVYRY